MPHKKCMFNGGKKHDKPWILGVPNAQHCSAASFMSFWTPFKRMEPGCWSQSSMVVTNDLLVIVQKNIKQHTELYIYHKYPQILFISNTKISTDQQLTSSCVAPLCASPRPLSGLDQLFQPNQWLIGICIIGI